MTNNHEPRIELFQPRRASTGEWLAAATVHTGEGQIRIVASAPQPVAARALAKAQAAMARYLGLDGESVGQSMPRPDYPVMDPPPRPPGLWDSVYAVLARVVRPAGPARQAALDAARQLPIVRRIEPDATAGLSEALQASARVVAQARQDEAYRERLLGSLERNAQMAQRIEMVLDAEDQAGGLAGVVHLGRLARAVALLHRARSGDADAEHAVTEITLRAANTSSESAARAAGALYVAAQTLPPGATTSFVEGYDDDALWHEAVGRRSSRWGSVSPWRSAVSPFNDAQIAELLQALQGRRRGWRRRSAVARVA